MSKIDYAKQYQHPKWQKKRLEILTRENYTCQSCGGKEDQLHIHHGYYAKGTKVWDYENETLWCLCSDCHEEWEEMKFQLYYFLGHLNMNNTASLCFQIQGIVTAQNNGAI